MTLNVPTSWQDVTVKEWQAINKILNEDRDDYLKECGIISVLTGVDVDDILHLTRKAHGDIMSELSFLKLEPTGKVQNTIKVNGTRYYFEKHARNITGGQYIDIQHYLDGDFVANLHHLLACFAVKRGWFKNDKYTGKDHDEVAKDMQDLPMSFVKPLTDFFLQDYLESVKAMAHYLEKKGRKLKRQAEKELKRSSRDGGGSMQ